MATLQAHMWPTSSCWAEVTGRAVRILMGQRRPELSGKALPTRNQSSSGKDQTAEKGPWPMPAGKQRPREIFRGEVRYTKKMRNKQSELETLVHTV